MLQVYFAINDKNGFVFWHKYMEIKNKKMLFNSRFAIASLISNSKKCINYN